MPSAAGSIPRTVAALYVEADGPYAGQPGVELWPEARDARLYAGPHPVVAHPPCARWSVLAGLVEATHGHRRGDDGGCFAAALTSVRRFGGVLEHPAQSSAWRWFGLCQPPSGGGWVIADWEGGWTCCVAQRNYGHRARKLTWLYAVGADLPPLTWGDGPATDVILRGGRTGEEVVRRGGMVQNRLSHRARAETPPAFRDMLLAMARTVPETMGGNDR